MVGLADRWGFAYLHLRVAVTPVGGLHTIAWVRK
jgi:hypothetical protein